MNIKEIGLDEAQLQKSQLTISVLETNYLATLGETERVAESIDEFGDLHLLMEEYRLHLAAVASCEHEHFYINQRHSIS